MQNNTISIKKIKQELLVAVVSVMLSAVVLVSVTYAWYVANSSVDATSSTVSAMANGMTLQIAAGTEADHGKDDATVAFDSTNGHQISPASTSDAKSWYVPQAWTQGAIVSRYQLVNFFDAEKGEYQVAGKTYNAYVLGTYTLYTIRDTGIADVYLDGSVDGGAIQVTLSDGSPIDDKIAKSMRIGIATVDKTTNEETLRVVYAPSEPTGSGNDVYSIANNIVGWITVKDTTQTMNSTYPYIYNTHYIDENNQDWAATKDGTSYIPPAENGATIASGVDYNGVIMKVYIWLEGTDADCVNTSDEQVNEENLYDVTLYLVGVETQ